MMRKEVARIIGGLYVRLALVLEQQPRVFLRAAGTSRVTTMLSVTVQHICATFRLVADRLRLIGSPPFQRTHNLDVGSWREIAMAFHMSMRPTVKKTERTHAGNRYRANTSSGRTRTWRRQVSQFVITRSR